MCIGDVDTARKRGVVTRGGGRARDRVVDRYRAAAAIGRVKANREGARGGAQFRRRDVRGRYSGCLGKPLQTGEQKKKKENVGNYIRARKNSATDKVVFRLLMYQIDQNYVLFFSI